MNLTKSSTLAVLAILFYCNPCSAQNWEVALRLNKKAEVIEGSKSKLINAIRQGCDVKIAWGWDNGEKSMEHISEPIWTAILNEEEVLFHIDPQVFGRTDWELLQGSFAESDLKNEWRVIIDTKGSFDAVWYDRDKNEVTRRVPQSHKMTWFIKGYKEKKANPFFRD